MYPLGHLLCICRLGGLPQIDFPLGEVDGAPVGLVIIGARGSDEALLALDIKLAEFVPMPQAKSQ